MAANSSSTPKTAAITCAENVAVMHLLHETPSAPFSNSLINHQCQRDGYALPFTRERSLTGILAFLARIDDNPNTIPAVCIEEAPAASCLRVLLAVNKAGANDGQQVLNSLQGGFSKLFNLLARVDDAASNAEGNIFTSIISMCSKRILCRMRLTENYKKIQKQPIKEVIQMVLDGFSSNQSARQLCTQSFVKEARNVMILIDAWYKHQTLTELERLVEGVYQLYKVGDIDSMIAKIPNRLLGESSRTNLVNTLCKVARYRLAARLLYRTAKKFPLARNMRTVIVALPSEAFDRVTTDRYNPSLQQAITTRDQLVEYKKKLGHVCRLLDVSQQQGNDLFVRQAKKTLRESKIHAEVQLVYYCELNSHRIPLWPRIIRSSKDACWLCNAFILSHGKMYTPKCHGKLYPGWRLPLLARSPFQSIANSYNHRLETNIKGSIQLMLAKNERIHYHNPQNESTLSALLHGVSASTLSSELQAPLPMSMEEEIDPVSHAEIQGGGDEVTNKSKENVMLSISGIQEEIPAEKQEDRKQETQNETERDTENEIQETPRDEIPEEPEEETVTTQEANDKIDVKHDCCPAVESEVPGISNSPPLRSRVVKSKELGLGQISPIHATGQLEIQFEYVTGSKTETTNCPDKRLAYKIEKVHDEDVIRLEAKKGISIVDAESLRGELEYDNTLSEVYIKASGSVLRLTFTRVA